MFNDNGETVFLLRASPLTSSPIHQQDLSETYLRPIITRDNPDKTIISQVLSFGYHPKSGKGDSKLLSPLQCNGTKITFSMNYYRRQTGRQSHR